MTGKINQAEQQLLFAQFTLDNAMDCIYWIQPDAHLAYVNKASCNLLGYSHEELLSKTIIDINPDYTEEIWTARWEQLKQKGDVFYETHHQSKDGRIKPVEVWANYIEFAGREYASTIVRDITERNEYQKQITLQKSVEAANLAKNRFLAHMSHELHTPLNAIIGYSEMLLHEAKDIDHETLHEDLQKIHKAGQHLQAMVGDILDLTSIEAEELELHIISIVVEDLVESISATMRSIVEKNGNRFAVVNNGNLGEMHTDLFKVQQVLFNLLNNAAKYTVNGKITLTASRETINNQEWLSFTVSDTGIGMNEDQLDRIFEKFAQTDQSTTRKYDGIGLGLTVSHEICDLLQGKISVTSIPGEGSTFQVHLPVSLRKLKKQGDGLE